MEFVLDSQTVAQIQIICSLFSMKLHIYAEVLISMLSIINLLSSCIHLYDTLFNKVDGDFNVVQLK